jgi:hypothetical protein
VRNCFPAGTADFIEILARQDLGKLAARMRGYSRQA